MVGGVVGVVIVVGIVVIVIAVLHGAQEQEREANSPQNNEVSL